MGNNKLIKFNLKVMQFYELSVCMCVCVFIQFNSNKKKKKNKIRKFITLKYNRE